MSGGEFGQQKAIEHTRTSTDRLQGAEPQSHTSGDAFMQLTEDRGDWAVRLKRERCRGLFSG